VPDGVTDHLLRRADRHPNAKGAELLGLRVLDLQAGKGADDVTRALGADGVLVAVGFNTHVEAIAGVVAHAKRVIALSGCRSALTERADIVVPGLTFAEKDGLVVNFEGHVQQLRAALDPHGAQEWRVADALIASLLGIAMHEFAAQIRKAIMDSVPAFAGVDLVKIGPNGVRVPAAAAVSG
jgi:NADH dehydrogenase/NADH:ubiquinone oxidoreductase subunit G